MCIYIYIYTHIIYIYIVVAETLCHAYFQSKPIWDNNTLVELSALRWYPIDKQHVGIEHVPAGGAATGYVMRDLQRELCDACSVREFTKGGLLKGV